MELKIEKNVPYKTIVHRSKLRLMLNAMEVGDSMEYGSEHFIDMRSQLRMLHRTKKRFTTKMANPENTKRRVWRSR